MTSLAYEKYVKEQQKTPKGKFRTQRANAKRRNIPWLLTFEEWWDIWQKSGKWDQRGTGANQYCMARILDCGAYKKGNVKITTMKKNSQEGLGHKITTI